MMKKMVETGMGEIAVHMNGTGPVILCVHGWPEHSSSWRHQSAYFADKGYTVAAMDVRGYGDSANPKEIGPYSLKHLAADAAAVIDAISADPVILFGHDWGAPITYMTALLHSEKVRAVAGMSVPYMPQSEVSMLDLMKSVYAGKFFYMVYFQDVGVPEAEFGEDPRAALRKIYYSISGEGAQAPGFNDKPADAKMLDGLIDPDPFPAWLSDEELDTYVEAFAKSGFHGPFNRYRALDLDHAELAEFRGVPLTLPTCFIGGEHDPVRSFVPGVDSFSMAGMACTDFRGATIVEGAGHWVQQEAPDATNAALEAFLSGL